MLGRHGAMGRVGRGATCDASTQSAVDEVKCPKTMVLSGVADADGEFALPRRAVRQNQSSPWRARRSRRQWLLPAIPTIVATTRVGGFVSRWR